MKSTLSSSAPLAFGLGFPAKAGTRPKAYTTLHCLAVVSGLALGGLVLAGSSAMAAPVTPAPPVLDSSPVQQVQYGYCRRWYHECRYRWGAGWRFRRCMRVHGC